MITFECPDAENGIALAVPPLHPINDINAPLGATHFRLMLRLASIDTTGSATALAVDERRVFDRLNTVPTTERKVMLQLPTAGATINVAIIGLVFYHSSREEWYSFNNGASDCAYITFHSMQ